MEKKKLKIYLLLIAYVLALILVVIHFETILSWIGMVFRLLLPLFIGIIIAFVFNRPYELFRKFYQRKLKLKEILAKILAIVTIYILAIGISVLLISLIIPELVDNLIMFAANANIYIRETQGTLNQIMNFLGFSQIDFSSLFALANQYIAELSNTLRNMLPQIINVTSRLISSITTIIIGIALSIYIMSGKERLLSQIKRLFRVYLPPKIYTPVRSVLQIVIQVFEDYVAGQCKEAVILGTLCFVGMTLLRLDYAGLISVIIAFTALVPILGAYIGGAIGVILLLFISPKKALIFLIFLIILQQFEGNVIYPRVVGRKIGLPGMWVLVAISVGGGLLGIWGMLIGVPITTIIYQLIQKDVQKREKEQLQAK